MNDSKALSDQKADTLTLQKQEALEDRNRVKNELEECANSLQEKMDENYRFRDQVNE